MDDRDHFGRKLATEINPFGYDRPPGAGWAAQISSRRVGEGLPYVLNLRGRVEFHVHPVLFSDRVIVREETGREVQRFAGMINIMNHVIPKTKEDKF